MKRDKFEFFDVHFNRPSFQKTTPLGMTPIIKRRKITVNPAIFHTRHETFIPLSPSFFGFMTSNLNPTHPKLFWCDETLGAHGAPLHKS